MNDLVRKEYTVRNLNNENVTIQRLHVKQNLSSVLNSPARNSNRSKQASFEHVNIGYPKGLPPVELQHFRKYVEQFCQNEREMYVNTNQFSFYPQDITIEDAEGALKRLREIVPHFFFSEDFHLQNPEVFNAICEPGLAAPGIQHEKLSHYLDKVEEEIINQIAARSRNFFSALSRLHHLRDEVTLACEEIHSLRKHMSSLDNSIQSSLDVVTITKRKENALAVYNKLTMIQTVKEAQPTVQLLLSSSDYLGALDLIEKTQFILKTELAGIQSLKHVSFQLAEMVLLIEKIMEEDFCVIAVGARDKLLQSVASNNNNNDNTTSNATQEMENALGQTVLCLLYLSKLHIVLQNYSERLARAIRSYVENMINLPPSDNLNKTQRLELVKEAIRALTSDEFLVKLQTDTFALLSAQLRRAETIHLTLSHLIHSVVNQIEESKNTESESGSGSSSSSSVGSSVSFIKLTQSIQKDYCLQLLDSSEQILYRCCDIIHNETSYLLNIRSNQTAKLNLIDFVKLYNSVKAFILQTESQIQKQCLTLRGALTSQAKAFLTNFHRTRTSTIALILENENWTQVDVASEFQDIVNAFVVQHYKPKEEINPALQIRGEDFSVANSALMLIKMLSEYLQCAKEIPILCTEVLTSMTELLGLWNSRTCQLVLGAGAVSIGNLKTISASNLILASRCLQLFIAIVPELKNRMTENFPENKHTLLNDFDRVKHDFIQHHEQIMEKVKDLMKSRVLACCKNLQANPIWNEPPTSPSPYILNLEKTIKSLYNILTTHLPLPLTQNLLNEVFAIYNSTLVECFSVLRLNNIGKKRLYQDINHLLDSLSKLAGVKEQVLSLMLLKTFYESQFGVPESN